MIVPRELDIVVTTVRIVSSIWDQTVLFSLHSPKKSGLPKQTAPKHSSDYARRFRIEAVPPTIPVARSNNDEGSGTAETGSPIDAV